MNKKAKLRRYMQIQLKTKKKYEIILTIKIQQRINYVQLGLFKKFSLRSNDFLQKFPKSLVVP